MNLEKVILDGNRICSSQDLAKILEKLPIILQGSEDLQLRTRMRQKKYKKYPKSAFSLQRQ